MSPARRKGRPYHWDVGQEPASVATPGELASWQAEFEAAAGRPLKTRWRYAFIRTYKPVLDDAGFRSFDTMAQYRDWCAHNLPSWLGYGPAF